LNVVKGIYVLIIQLRTDADVTVGRLGTLHFPEGLYVYVGSAQTALEKRIERHLRKEKQLHWHVDYLLQCSSAKVLKIFCKNAGKPEECNIASKIATKGEGVNGFGCSDCRCKSHLFRISNCDFLAGFMQEYEMPKLSADS
jgi:Uri superfamily endonuclease